MSAGDLPAVLDIQAACYTALVPESRQSLHAKLRASPSTCLVASISDETVGYLIALPWESSSPPALNTAECRLPSSPDCLHLHDLAVTPAARKLGAGRMLVQAFLARLEASGLGGASLVAVQDSAPYWERFGFRAVPASASLESTLSTYGQEVRYMVRDS